MTLSVTELWQYYAVELLQLAFGKNFNHTHSAFDPACHHFTVAGLILAADLGNKDQGIANLNRYLLANNIPAWSLAYTSWSQVFTAYRIFLDFIDLNPEAKASSSTTLQTLHDQLMAELSASVMTHYSMPAPLSEFMSAQRVVNFLSGRICDNRIPVSLTEVMQGAGRSVPGQQTPNIEKLRAQLYPMKLAAYGQFYVSILEAINRCSDTGGAADITGPNQYNMLITTDPATGYHSYAPGFTIPGFDEKYQEWLANSTPDRTDATIALNTNSRHVSSKWAEDHTDVLLSQVDFFLHPCVTNYYLQQSGYEFELSFTRLGVFQLLPGAWFDLHLLEAYKASLPANAPRFFGPGGSLSLLPSLAILCLEPELKMRWAEPQSYKRVKAICQATPALPRGLNSDADGTASAEDASAALRFVDESSTIIFGPVKTSVPNLLGVISLKL